MPLFKIEIDNIRLADIEKAKAIIEKNYDMPMNIDHFLRYCIIVQTSEIIKSEKKFQ